MPSLEDMNVDYEPDAAVEAFIADLTGSKEDEDDEAAITAAEGLDSEEDTDSDEESEDATEEEVVSVPVDDKGEAGAKEKAALDRIAAREESVRNAESDFDKRLTAALNQKVTEFRGKDHKDLIKNAGLEEEIVFKLMLLERVSDTKPELKAKLEAELKDYHSDKKIKDLEDKINQKETDSKRAEEDAKYIATYTSTAREYVDKLDEKVAPILSQFVKAGKADKAHAKVMAVVARDAQLAYARGESRDVLTPAEATKLVEAELAELAEVLSHKVDKTVPKAKTGSITNLVAAPKLQTPKPVVARTDSDDYDDLLERGIKVGLSTVAKQRLANKKR